MKTEPNQEDDKKEFPPTENDDGIHTLFPDTSLCNISVTGDDNMQPLETLFESITTLDAEFGEPVPTLEKKPTILFSEPLESSSETSTNFTEKPASINPFEDKETQTSEEFNKTDKEDFSILQPPLDLGLKNVRQILTCVQSGSLEVQDIIFNECNVIYECKVCHNLFRCLANLLSHKRFYCKDSYAKVYDAFKKQTQSDVTVVIEPESPPELDEEEPQDMAIGGDAEVDVTNTPSLTEIQISTPKIFTPVSESKPFTREIIPEESRDETFIHLERIQGNQNAVYQTVFETSDKMDDSVSLPVDIENTDKSETLQTVPYSNSIFITREKKLMKRSDCDIKNLTCLKCTLHFDTLKGLYVHMMSAHPSKRIYFPCIYCKTSFIRMYSVTRHMMKFHKKTKEQVSRLRDIVRRRAFVCKGPLPPEQFPLNKESETETVAPPKLHACGKCNRQFERKSSQISHEKYCRFGGSEPAPICHKKKKIPATAIIHHRCVKCSRTFKHKSSQISHSKFCKGNILRKPSPKEKPKVFTSPIKKEFPVAPIKPRVIVYKQIDPEENTRPKRDAKKKNMSKDFVSSQSLKWRSANKVEAVSGSKGTASPKSVSDQNTTRIELSSKKSSILVAKKTEISVGDVKISPSPKSTPQARQQIQSNLQTRSSPLVKTVLTEKPSLNLLMKSPQYQKNLSVNIIEGRMYSIINAHKLSCLKCSRKFSTFSNLKRHAATHIGWMRFKCKHCSYQCFNRSDCRSHIQRMHPGSYTNVNNIDRNIIKLATGKFNVRREDMMSDGAKKPLSKSTSPQESVSPKELQDVKLPKTISSVVLKSVPSTDSVYRAADTTQTPKQNTLEFKETVEVKTVKPVTSLVLKTNTVELSEPPRFAKSSARKSTGGVPKRLLKASARKSTGGVPKRDLPYSSRKSTEVVPKKIIKSSARKSTGGVPKKQLKKIMTPTAMSSNLPQKSKQMSPSTSISPLNPSSSPLGLRRKTPPASSSRTQANQNIPSSSPPQLSLRKKTLPQSLEGSHEDTPRSSKGNDHISMATTLEASSRVINILKGSKRGEASSMATLETTKIINILKPSRKSETGPSSTVLDTNKIIDFAKHLSRKSNFSTPTKTVETYKYMNLVDSSKKGEISSTSLESPPKIINVLKTSKVLDVSSATTKPHVIVLNSTARADKSDPPVIVLSPSRTRSDKTQADPNTSVNSPQTKPGTAEASTITLVTRASTYTKTSLIHKVVKTNIKQRNSQSSESSDGNQNSNSQLFDHQYT